MLGKFCFDFNVTLNGAVGKVESQYDQNGKVRTVNRRTLQIPYAFYDRARNPLGIMQLFVVICVSFSAR